MERDLVLGYLSIKFTSFLAMVLHQREEPASALWIVACILGFLAGFALLLSSWRKARALVEPSGAERVAAIAKTPSAVIPGGPQGRDEDPRPAGKVDPRPLRFAPAGNDTA